MKQRITFHYPLTDISLVPAFHFTDLLVTAFVDVGRLNKVMDVEIYKVSYFSKKELIGADVQELILFLKPQLHKEIILAAYSHAKDKIETQTT